MLDPYIQSGVHTRMAKTPFQIRLDDDRMKRLVETAAKMQMSKTEILEAGLDMKLAQLNGYVEMDKGPPKVVKTTRPKTLTISAGVTPIDGKPIKITIPTAPGSIRGYAADGTAILR